MFAPGLLNIFINSLKHKAVIKKGAQLSSDFDLGYEIS